MTTARARRSRSSPRRRRGWVRARRRRGPSPRRRRTRGGRAPGRAPVARSRAGDALYGLMARSPDSDDAGAGVGVALTALPPRTPPERVALARAMKTHGAAADARLEVERAIRAGDSSAATLVLAGELFAAGARPRAAARRYPAAARGPTRRALALYRRARLLVRLGDQGAQEALAGVAQSFPPATAPPPAPYPPGAHPSDPAGAARA